MKKWLALTFFASLASLLLSYQNAPAQQTRPDLVKRGEYLVRIMDCGGCHTVGGLFFQPDNTKFLIGDTVGFTGPWGTAYPKNLTPDDETGLGKWTDEEIIKALRLRVRKNGKPTLPMMPTFDALSDEDARAVAAYLKSLKPVKNVVPENLPPGVEPKTPYITIIFPGKKQ